MLSSDARHVWIEAASTPIDWEWYKEGEFKYAYYKELMEEGVDVHLYFTCLAFTSH